MIPGSGTTRRLFVAFASLLVIFGAATYASIAALVAMHDSLHGVERHEAGVRTALSSRTSAASRQGSGTIANSVSPASETSSTMRVCASSR